MNNKTAQLFVGSLLNFGLDLTVESLSNQDSGIVFNKRPLPTIIEDKSKSGYRRKSFAARSLGRESIKPSGVPLGITTNMEHTAGTGSVSSYQTQSLSNTRLAVRDSHMTVTETKQAKTREVTKFETFVL